MTGRATGELDCRPDLVFRGQLFADFFLIRGGFPIHVENLVLRSDVLFGIAVAVKAPLHSQGRGLKDKRHLVDRAMARRAADSLIDVNTVIEIDVVGEAVNPDPLNRFVGFEAIADRFEIIDIVEENGVAIHAGFCGRNSRVGGSFDAGVTVTTVDAIIADVVLVAELDGLLPGDALVGDVRRTRHKQHTGQGKSAKHNGYEQTKPRNKIHTTMKNLCHVSGAPESQPLRNV